NLAEAVPVSADDTQQTVALEIYPQLNRARIQLHSADKVAIPSRGALEAGPASGRGGGWSTSAETDSTGALHYDFSSPGLWHVRFSYTDEPLRSIPLRQEPRYEAEAVIAVSP